MIKKKLISLGINLGLAGSMAVLAWVFGPSVWVEARYRQQVKQQAQMTATGIVQPSKSFASLMTSLTGFQDLLNVPEAVSKPEEVQPLSGQFGLVIPKIFVNVGVTENVNPAKKDVYQRVLSQAGGVAHAAGSAVPGEEGTIYIFGHSTDSSFNVQRFNAVFYLLKKLEPGDTIIAYYYYVPYRYTVMEKKTVAADDISDITNVANEERLVLQTCWPPGTNWKRLLIIAKPETV